MKGTIAVAAALLLAGICGCDSLPAGRSAVYPVQFSQSVGEINDARHDEGNPGFTFLPPLVPASEAVGEPVTDLLPRVNISGPGLDIHFTRDGGPDGENIRVDEAEGHYILTWHTGAFELEASAVYRISVEVGGIELGFADVIVGKNPSELKSIPADEFVALKDGRTLPIKFRIEIGAVYMLGTSAATIVTPDDDVVLELPSGALSRESGITVLKQQEVAVAPPEGIELLEGTLYEFSPDGLEFDQPAMLTLSYDEAALKPSMSEDALIIYGEHNGVWAPVQGCVVDRDNNTVRGVIDGFSMYAVAYTSGDPIAFHSNRAGDFEIYVMNPDGSNPVNISTFSGMDIMPAFSRNGNTIAFFSRRAVTGYGLYAIDYPAQSNLRLVAGALRRWGQYPSWSPDGAHIAWKATTDTMHYFVIAVNSDGTGFHYVDNVVSLDNTPISWSGDSRYMTFTDATGDIRIVSFDETELYTVLPGRSPNWSPVADEIVYMSDGIEWSDPFGSDYLRLTAAIDTDFYPVWSPDGGRVAFLRSPDPVFGAGEPVNCDIHVINRDGSGLVNCTNNPGSYSHVSWFGDGSRLVAEKTESGQSDVVVVNADGTGTTNTTNSPDSYDGWKDRAF